jgi:hypothetical protein
MDRKHLEWVLGLIVIFGAGWLITSNLSNGTTQAGQQLAQNPDQSSASGLSPVGSNGETSIQPIGASSTTSQTFLQDLPSHVGGVGIGGRITGAAPAIRQR